MKKYGVNILKYATMCAFLIVCLLIAVNCLNVTQKELTVQAQLLSEENEIPFDREEIKIDEVNLSANRYSAKAGEQVIFSFQVLPSYAIETIKNVNYEIVGGKNYAKIHNDVLQINDNAKAYEEVIVQACINDIWSNKVKILIQKTQVQEFEIGADILTVREGGTAQVYVEKMLPNTASFQDVKFEIVEGQEYANINELTGEVKVKDTINSANAKVVVRALTCENYVKVSNEVELSIYVPVKNMTLTANSYKAKISSTQSQDISLNVQPNGVVTNFNPTYVIDSRFTQYCSIENNVLHINKGINKAVSIPIWAEQDGVESNTIYIEVYIITEAIELVNSEGIAVVSQFKSYDFSAKVYPSYASSKNLQYSLVDDMWNPIKFASINSLGLLTIKDEAPVNSKFRLVIQNEDISREIELTVDEYNTQTILMTTDSPTDYLWPHDVVNFSAVLDGQYTTQNHFVVEGVSGDLDAIEIKTNSIVVKNLYELEKLQKNILNISVRLKSTNNVYSNTKQFTIKIPVTSMQNQTIYVDRGSRVNVDMYFNYKNFASNKNIKTVQPFIFNNNLIDFVTYEGRVKVILPTQLNYNQSIQFEVTSEDGEKKCTITLIVKELNIANFTTVISEMDSSEQAINSLNPQLWVGRSVNVDLKYNGLDISEYGLSIKTYTVNNAKLASYKAEIGQKEFTFSKEFTSTSGSSSFTFKRDDSNSMLTIRNAGITKVNAPAFAPSDETTYTEVVTHSRPVYRNYIKLTANNVDGESEIYYTIIFNDGYSNQTYVYHNNKIKVFKPVEMNDAVYIEDINGVKNNKITFYGPSLDIQPYYRYDLKGGSPLTNIWITSSKAYASGSVVKITKSTPWQGFQFEIHYSQTYNGREYEMGLTTINASLGYNKTMYLDYKPFGSEYNKDVIGKKEYSWFFGIPYDSDDNNPSGGVAWGDFKYISMEWNKLLETGFTKIRMNIKLDIAEIEEGEQEVYVILDNDTNLNNLYVEVFRDTKIKHGGDEKVTSWSTHTFIVEVPITQIIERPYLIIACGAHGQGSDTWRWGWTRINFEAI